MRRIATFFIAAMMILTLASGCAQKSASEQLRDDMNKAGKQMQKDMNQLIN